METAVYRKYALLYHLAPQLNHDWELFGVESVCWQAPAIALAEPKSFFLKMTRDEPTLKKIVMTRLTRLNALVSGLVTGLIFGLLVFIATNWLLLKGGEPIGPHLALLGQFFLGYTVSFAGSLVGLIYGFVTGFILGYAVAFLYNIFLRLSYNQRDKS
jgi:hypothetical protein